MIDLTVLADELNIDPEAIGYAGMTDVQAADALNAKVSTRPQWQIMESADFVGNTDPAEWAGLTDAEKQRYQTIVGAGQVDARYSNVRSAFNQMFPDPSPTRDALLAIAQRDGSRAEELFGEGIGAITPSQVADAWRSIY